MTNISISATELQELLERTPSSYSRIRNESDRLIDNILKLRQMYDYFGHNSGIVNIPKDEEQQFDK